MVVISSYSSTQMQHVALSYMNYVKELLNSTLLNDQFLVKLRSQYSCSQLHGQQTSKHADKNVLNFNITVLWIQLAIDVAFKDEMFTSEFITSKLMIILFTHLPFGQVCIATVKLWGIHFFVLGVCLITTKFNKQSTHT